MNDADRHRLETRVLLWGCTVKDGELTSEILARAGIACIVCADQVQVCQQLTAGAGAVLMAEEAVDGNDDSLSEWLGRQPPWSDLPVLVLARAGEGSATVAWALEKFGNVTVVEQTARVAALVSAVRSALRARQRQYLLRDHLQEREQIAERLDLAMAAAHAGSWQVNLTTGEFTASDRAIALHGLPPGAQMNQERALACVHPDDRASIESALRLTLETGQPFRHEHRVLHPDGSVRWVSSHAERRCDDRHTYVIGLVQDVTERKQTEETQQLLASIVENSRDFIGISDMHGNPAYGNRAAMELVGIKDLEQVQRSKIIDYFIPQQRQFVAEVVLPTVALDGRWSGELTMQRFDTGATIPVWFDLFRVDDRVSGQPVNLATITRDLTDSKRVEQALAKRTELLNGVLESTADVVFVKDLNGRCLMANAACAAVLGFIPEQVVGKTAEELCPPDVAAAIRQHDESVIAGGLPDQREETFLVAGEPRLFLTLKAPLRDDAGRIVGIVGVSRDITDRKCAEEALRVSETRLNSILRHSPAGIVQTDAAGCMTLVNPRWCEMLGYPEGELLGRSLTEITHPSFVSSTAATLDRLAAGGPDLQIEKAYCRKDGSVLRTQSNIAAVRSPEGEFLGLIAVVVDISERLRTEEELQRLAGKLSEADRRKDVFLATLAHELRNPLAPLRNGLQVMKLTKNNGEAFEQVRIMMDRQLSQLVRLVDDLLEVSRITSGKLDLRKERIDLKAVIEGAVEMSRPALEHANHDLEVIVPDESIFVDADAVRLTQVVSNLLNNSAKYTRRGGRVRLMVEREDASVVVSVKDNGIGIPPAMIGRVFEMFTQVDRTLEKTTGGLGIGLSLVKGLLEMHGGAIEAKSDGEGMGSEFVVRLPVATTVVAGSDRSHGQTSEAVSSARRRILIVDDNVDAADSLGQFLEMSGHEVRTANDGETGVAVAAQFLPAVVLMDIGMPRLNGHEAARQIRQHPWGRAMVLVALTGWGQEDDRKKSADAGFDHHLVKPVDMKALMHLMPDLKCVDVDVASAAATTLPNVDGASVLPRTR